MNSVRSRSLSIALVLALASIAAVMSVSPVAASSETARFVPVTPTRVLDTRDGTGAPAGVRAADSTTTLRVAGAGPVPGDAVAVVLNATVTEATNAGFVQIYPTGIGTPGASSNLNVAGAGSTIANTVIVPVGVGGEVSVLMNAGGHILLDVFGYFEPAAASSSGRFQSLDAPTRVLDTRAADGVPIENPGNVRNCGDFATWDEANRWYWTYSRHGDPAGLDGNNNGIPCQSLTGSPSTPMIPSDLHRLAADTVLRLPVRTDATPAGGVVPPNASAVVVNVTATGASAAGFLQLYASPTGATPGDHSNVNYIEAAAAPNLAIVPVGADGAVMIYTSAATEVIVDVVGYFTGTTATASSDGLFVPVTPERVKDTRSGAPLPPEASDTVNVAALAGLNADAIAAVFVNATIVEAVQSGYLQLYPTGQGTPGASSNVNVAAAGETRPNAAVTGLASGQVTVFHFAGGHYLLDLAGYFTTGPATPGDVNALLEALTIAPQNTTVTYNRSDWPHWTTVACQDTRARVLIRDSTTTVTFNETGCRVTAGSWTDPWTGINYTLAADVDIDHTVALANAHRSGGWAWTTDDKRAFANDMTNPAALRPMGKAANIAKSDKGPEEWRPPLSETWCDYATDWATIKITWELTVTVPEHAALDEMLDTC